MYWQPARFVALFALFAIPGFAQQTSTPAASDVSCAFEDGQQTRISYTPDTEDVKKELPRDKVWTPGNQPMNLFTDTAITLGGTEIPPGAYSLYILPGKDKWTLIVNKNVTPGHEYDASQDLTRSEMETGDLPEAQPFQLGFARMKPKQCSLRIYYGKTGAWAEFNEQQH